MTHIPFGEKCHLSKTSLSLLGFLCGIMTRVSLTALNLAFTVSRQLLVCCPVRFNLRHLKSS